MIDSHTMSDWRSHSTTMIPLLLVPLFAVWHTLLACYLRSFNSLNLILQSLRFRTMTTEAFSTMESNTLLNEDPFCNKYTQRMFEAIDELRGCGASHDIDMLPEVRYSNIEVKVHALNFCCCSLSSLAINPLGSHRSCRVLRTFRFLWPNVYVPASRRGSCLAGRLARVKLPGSPLSQVPSLRQAPFP